MSSGPPVSYPPRNKASRARWWERSHDPVLSPCGCGTFWFTVRREGACNRRYHHLHRLAVRSCAHAAWVCTYGCSACDSSRVATRRRLHDKPGYPGDTRNVPQDLCTGVGAGGARGPHAESATHLGYRESPLFSRATRADWCSPQCLASLGVQHSNSRRNRLRAGVHVCLRDSFPYSYCESRW
jgi:hypothetical protein